jgi:hypothetical protein
MPIPRFKLIVAFGIHQEIDQQVLHLRRIRTLSQAPEQRPGPQSQFG